VTDKAVFEPPAAPSGGAIEPDPLRRRFLNPWTLLSFALGLGVLLLVLSRVNVEVDAILARLSQTDPLYYLAALLVYYTTFLVRALRWRTLLENVGFRPEEGVPLPPLGGIAAILLLSWFANCIVPAKLGDAYRAYLLKRTARVSFTKTFGTILAERIIDMIFLFVLLVGSAVLAFGGALPPVILGIMQAGLVLVGAAIVGLLTMRGLSRQIKRLVPGRFRGQYDLLEQGTLGAFGSWPPVLLYSTLEWAIEGARLYLVCLSLDLTQLAPTIIVFVALSSALLTTLPVTPAGLGFVESAIVGILLLAASVGLAPGIDENVATSVAILDRTISYWSLVFIGAGVYLFGRKRLEL
jgi:glycosyltransferase 2 family protein